MGSSLTEILLVYRVYSTLREVLRSFPEPAFSETLKECFRVFEYEDIATFHVLKCLFFISGKSDIRLFHQIMWSVSLFSIVYDFFHFTCSLAGPE